MFTYTVFAGSLFVATQYLSKFFQTQIDMNNINAAEEESQ